MKNIQLIKNYYKNRLINKKNFSWFQYIWNLIKFGSKDKDISNYEEFRAKLISEENIIQSNLDVYKLLKEVTF